MSLSCDAGVALDACCPARVREETAVESVLFKIQYIEKPCCIQNKE